MAAISLIIASFLGLFGAVTGWVFYDMSLLAAFGVYMIFSLVMFALTILAMMIRDNDDMAFQDFGAA